jgi:hypothetical protein
LAIGTSGKSHPDTSTFSPEQSGNPEGRDFSSLPVDYEKREPDKSRRGELLAIRNRELGKTDALHGIKASLL